MTVFKQRSIHNFSRAWVGEEDCPLELFLTGLSQPQLQEPSVQKSYSPLGYLAPFLQAWALQHTTDLALLEDATQKDKMRPDYLHRCWESNRKCMKAIESVEQSLSKCLRLLQDPPSEIEVLYQEYVTLLQRSRDQSQDLMAFLQQTSALESIRESQKGVQSADSVRR